MASESLKFLLEKVHSGKVVLPEFQRDFVWPQSAVIKLMTSIFNGYPIGSLLLMENNDAYSYRTIDGVSSEVKRDHADQDLILDGQQRVTSCYRAFYGTLEKEARNPGRYYFRYSEYVKARLRGETPDGSSIGTSDQRLRLRRDGGLIALASPRRASGDRFRGIVTALSAVWRILGRVVLTSSAFAAPGTGCRARTA